MNCPACGLGKEKKVEPSQVVYSSRIHPLMWRDDATEEFNRAFSVLEAVQEHLLGVTDLGGFVAKLEAIRKVENA